MSRAFAVLLLLLCCTSASAVQVRTLGAVAQSGVHELKRGARLSDGAIEAQPLPQAYMLGAAWLRPSLINPQQQLKAGVLFDLGRVRRSASAKGRNELGDEAMRMEQWLQTLPVTGRQPGNLLDPRVIEVSVSANHLLADGDQLYYPIRPADIQVVGAVVKPCTLPLVPLQDARRYAAACISRRSASIDTIYVIQPDGRVFVQDIALWNRRTPLPLAPGALIFVPLRGRALEAKDSTLNNDIATFLATQLLAAPGLE